MRPNPVQLFDRLEQPRRWSEPVDLETDTVAAGILDRVLTDTGNVVSLDAARRRRRTVAAAITVTAVVAGGAVAAIWDRTAHEARQVACWSEAADPPESRSFLPWDGVSDPAALCAAEWAAGRFGAPAPAAELEVCVTGSRVAAAIPGDDGVCDSLGFAKFSPSFDSPAVALGQAQRELDRRFNRSTCRSSDFVAAATPAVLEDYGLTGWNINIAGPTSADEPCASVSLALESATAFVVPVARQG